MDDYDTFMKTLEHEPSKTTLSIKFPDIYANTPSSQSPTFSNSGNSSPGGASSSRSMSSSLNDLQKFAKDCKHAEELLNASQKADTELVEIKNDLIKVIVNTLMLNNDKDWNVLIKYLDSLRPLRKCVENDRRIAHYLERIYSYTNRVGHRGPCRLTLKKLEDLFPSSMGNLKSLNKQRTNVNRPSAERIEQKKPENLVPEANIDFYKGHLDPYKKQLKEIKFNTETGPLVSEIHKSLAKATYESFKCN